MIALLVTLLLGLAPAVPTPAEWSLYGPGAVELVIADDLHDDWQVTEAAARWNQMTGCRLFSIRNHGAGAVYAVVETPGLERDGQEYWGWWSRRDWRIELNATGEGRSPDIRVPMHELGHAVGLDHSDDPDAVMYPEADGSVTPTLGEVDEVRERHAEWCGP